MPSPDTSGNYHAEARERRREREAARAQELIDRFVAQATQDGIEPEDLMARPWSGRGRYKTGVVGWYVRRDGSVGVGVDGSYYVLVVPPRRFGRRRAVDLEATPPPLLVGEGGRDGDAVALEVLLESRLQWATTPDG
jgi:hypothetical protein